MPLGQAYKFSLAKLFVDQAVPAAGISGTVVMARALERHGSSRSTVMAGVVVNTVSYYATYIVCLAAALAAAVASGHSNALIIAAAALFFIFSVTMTAGFLTLSGRKSESLPGKVRHISLVRKTLDLVRQAEPRLARSPRLIAQASIFQLAIILFDTATIWVLIRSLGAKASPVGVFTSFMISTLLRTFSILPGGLGIFEAASVVTLKLAGIDVPVALSATLLFRGLSFWLPMLPGLIFSRGVMRARSAAGRPAGLEAYWSRQAGEVAGLLGTTAEGLASAEAERRLAEYGPNELTKQRHLSRARVLWNQVRSPLLLLLLFAVGASAAAGEWSDSVIVAAIVLASVGIGYAREYSAQSAAAELQARVHVKANAIRDGHLVTVPLREVVPGDVISLSAGSLVPADAVILEATDFYVNEAVLTGESFPVEKKPGLAAAAARLTGRTNCVFLGTNVRSGTARCLVVDTGPSTQFGAIARRLTLRSPETEFDRGIRKFGYLLTTSMSVMVMLVFAANMLLGRAPVETLLFTIALAVGLSPELLPAILSVNLARGMRMMARHGVLVRKLNAIENLGSMDVLCTDKTGTLTEGVIELEGAYDQYGVTSPSVLELGALNAALQTGMSNPLDEAILKALRPNLTRVGKLAEVPFDFVRKRLSVVIRTDGGIRLISKGAFQQVLEACSSSAGEPLTESRTAALEELFLSWSRQGIRVLAVAARSLGDKLSYGRDDDRDLDFLGFLSFLDRPKEGAAEALADLDKLGVSVKLITGDVKLVAQHIAGRIKMAANKVLTGRELDELHDEALWQAAQETDLFVEVDPNQKERIILSLKKMGHVVGFLGDGVNDAPAMHAADTSLSVEQAADVAREAADFVLLKRDLDVIRRGIEEGRRTFANTLKYILTTTSANLGNMLSMAVVSLLLPFLPLLAGQILLNNFLSDIPAIGMADDNVDPELVGRPRRWDIRFIGRFMVQFGLLSSVFDFLTFGALLGLFAAAAELFRTGWFFESLLTELAIALVVRTRRPIFKSRPGTLLLLSSLSLIILTFAIPYIPIAHVLGFVPLPPGLLATMVVITSLYILAAEMAKARFFRKEAQ